MLLKVQKLTKHWHMFHVPLALLKMTSLTRVPSTYLSSLTHSLRDINVIFMAMLVQKITFQLYPMVL
jgi:hypothetical protein